MKIAALHACWCIFMQVSTRNVPVKCTSLLTAVDMKVSPLHCSQCRANRRLTDDSRLMTACMLALIEAGQQESLLFAGARKTRQ
jgi:hypothetical protein